MRYRLMVLALRLAAWCARSGWPKFTEGILADAEGDAGYYRWRRPREAAKWEHVDITPEEVRAKMDQLEQNALEPQLPEEFVF